MRFLAIVLLLVSLGGCISNKDEIRILFTGDILLSRNVRNEIEQKNLNPWFEIENEFKNSDLVIGNLEGAVGRPPAVKDNMIFDVDAKSIILLKEAGFSVMTVENNHSNDLGPENKDTTVLKLAEAGIISVSKDNSPWFLRVKKHTFSLIAINLAEDRYKLNDTIPSIQLRQKLQLAKRLSELVIVSVHWGNELLDWPVPYQREVAEWLIDNGADLIIGHHPHVIQNAEIIKGKPVFFSLGNHLFDQKYEASKKGLIVECNVKNGKICYNGILTKTMKNSFFPATDKKVSFKELGKTRLSRVEKIHDYSLLPLSILSGKEGRIVLDGSRKGKKLWSTQPISLISLYEAKFEKQNNYLFTLEKHFSTIDKEFAPRPYVYRITDTGLEALWRGSGLSRPLIDATLTKDKKYLIALHRSDPFINPVHDNNKTITELYRWNGFGFSGIGDSSILRDNDIR